MLKNIFNPTPATHIKNNFEKIMLFNIKKKLNGKCHADQLCKVDMLEKSFRLYALNQKTKNINYAHVCVR